VFPNKNLKVLLRTFCTPFGFMSSPLLWGTLYWSHFIHRGTLPYLKKKLDVSTGQKLQKFWKMLCFVLSCPSCQYHCVSNQAQHPPPVFQTGDELWDYEVRFHNAVNVQNGLLEFDPASALAHWKQYHAPVGEDGFWLAVIFVLFTGFYSDHVYTRDFLVLLSVKLPFGDLWFTDPETGVRKRLREDWEALWSDAERTPLAVSQPIVVEEAVAEGTLSDASGKPTSSKQSLEVVLLNNLETLSQVHNRYAKVLGGDSVDAETLNRRFGVDCVLSIKNNLDMSRAMEMRKEDHAKMKELREERDAWRERYDKLARGEGCSEVSSGSSSDSQFVVIVVVSVLLGVMTLYLAWHWYGHHRSEVKKSGTSRSQVKASNSALVATTMAELEE